MIVSANLIPFVDDLLIDSNREYGMSRVVREKGAFKQVFTDHYTLILKLTNLPTKENMSPTEN